MIADLASIVSHLKSGRRGTPANLDVMGKEIQKRVPYVPLAADVALIKSGLLEYAHWPTWIPLALLPFALVCAFPHNVGFFRKDTRHGEVDAYRAEIEYPPVPWLRIVAPVLSFATDEVGYALPIHIPPLAIVLVAFVAITTAVTYSFGQIDRVALRQGARRSRMLAAKGLDGVTVERIDIARRHAQLCRTLIRHNWFDGIRAQMCLVAHHLDCTPAEVRAAAAELELAGLARVSTIMHADDPDRWWVELTELGVRTSVAAQRR